jgi:hypothetical protein
MPIFVVAIIFDRVGALLWTVGQATAAESR